jgi:hypothetical protein
VRVLLFYSILTRTAVSWNGVEGEVATFSERAPIMNKNVFHVFYVATSVFVAIFLVALYARPLAASPARPGRTVTIRERTVIIEPKYIFVPQKVYGNMNDAKKY